MEIVRGGRRKKNTREQTDAFIVLKLNCFGITSPFSVSTHSVAASYKPSMLVTWVRLPVCAETAVAREDCMGRRGEAVATLQLADYCRFVPWQVCDLSPKAFSTSHNSRTSDLVESFQICRLWFGPIFTGFFQMKIHCLVFLFVVLPPDPGVNPSGKTTYL